MKPIYIILILWNIITFALMGIDKHKSRKKQWRIKESTLLLCALCMGAAGSFLGMIIFRHKTKHTKFVIGLPICFIINLVILYYFLRIIV